jgi:deoxycytidylate deaminase
VDTLTNYLGQFGYQANHIHLTDLFSDLMVKLGAAWEPPAGSPELARYKIEAGNKIRELTGRDDFLALVAAGSIASKRGEKPEPLEKTAHIITTLKRPEEATTLRRIYGSGFFLIGLSSPKRLRDEYFSERGMEELSADLVETDAAEVTDHGQQLRETFHLADVFVSMEGYSEQVGRFLDLVFGAPTITPTLEEHSMFMAYSASLRSGDLSRQVGAAIIDSNGDLLSVGCNEVPKFGGGLYGPEAGSQRDIERGEDSNEIERIEMIQRIIKALERTDLNVTQARSLLKPTGVTDITEFGRAVHAEMEALFACARTGRSVRSATLYATTFPCHNCCRHIIAAGIRRVIYIEPYAKSKAPALHGDAISVDEESTGRLPFMPFIGIGPRRFFDLFSLTLSTGYPIERKEEGKLKVWTRSSAPPRLQLQPSTYPQRESLAFESVKALTSKRESND